MDGRCRESSLDSLQAHTIQVSALQIEDYNNFAACFTTA